MKIKILQPGDERRLESYLEPRADSSMILRSNLRSTGLLDRGDSFQGSYAAALSGSRVAGVVAHYWNGNLIPQAPPERVPELVRAAVKASKRAVAGAVGPAEQVTAALEALGLSRARKKLDGREGLYALPLDALKTPAVLGAQRIRARRVQPSDREPLLRWFQAYEVEVLGETPGPELERECERRFARHCDGVPGYLLLRDDDPVAFSGFNATLPDAVQVGGVYTPPEERGKGFARAVVAHSLAVARSRGARRALLFTGDDDQPALRAYHALGFTRTGDFRLTLLSRPRSVASGSERASGGSTGGTRARSLARSSGRGRARSPRA